MGEQVNFIQESPGNINEGIIKLFYINQKNTSRSSEGILSSP